ncbi:hypothetical protein NRB_07460 [Novosphingobium sp. 11B]
MDGLPAHETTGEVRHWRARQLQQQVFLGNGRIDPLAIQLTALSTLLGGGCCENGIGPFFTSYWTPRRLHYFFAKAGGAEETRRPSGAEI